MHTGQNIQIVFMFGGSLRNLIEFNYIYIHSINEEKFRKGIGVLRLPEQLIQDGASPSVFILNEGITKSTVKVHITFLSRFQRILLRI